MTHLRSSVLLAALLMSVVGAARVRADSDVRDFEGVAWVPNNTVVAFGYFRHLQSTEGNLSENQAVFRGTYVLRFGNLAVVPFDASLPIVDVNSYAAAPAPFPSFEKLSIHAEGIADPEYFPAIGYILTQDAASGTHTVFAFNPRFTLPLGSYDASRFPNVGSHMFTFKPQVAVAQRFAKAFTAEVVANLAFHTDNSKYTFPNPMTGALVPPTSLRHAMDFALDAHLAADLSRSFFASVSYYMLVAGKQTLPDLNGTLVAPSTTVHSLRFSLGIRIEPNTLALLQFNQDIATTHDAPIERFVGIRLSHAFFEQPQPSHPDPKPAT